MTLLAGLVGWVGILWCVLIWWMRARRNQERDEFGRVAEQVGENPNSPDWWERGRIQGATWKRWYDASRASWTPLAPLWITCIVLADHVVAGLACLFGTVLVLAWFALRLHKIWHEPILDLPIMYGMSTAMPRAQIIEVYDPNGSTPFDS